MPLQQQRIGNLVGVNLRRDRLSLADEEMARAINADLYSHPGVVLGRAGKRQVLESALGTAGSQTVRWIERLQSRRYTVIDNEVFRHQTEIITNLAARYLTCNMFAFRPLNDTTTWVFFVNGDMSKDDGTTLRNWGSEPPVAAPTLTPAAPGDLVGNYSARYTYARVVSGSVAYETNPSPQPGTVSLGGFNFLKVDVVASADGQITNIRIYRTQAGGSIFLFDQQVANSTATINSTKIDSLLGEAMETDNNQPSVAGWGVVHQGHVFLVQAQTPTSLYWSKRFRPEQFPTTNFLSIGNADDPLECAFSIGGFLGLFARKTKYRILGNSTTGFAAQESLSSRGIVHPNGAALGEYGVSFIARDGIFLTDFLSPDRLLSAAIEPLFFGETRNDYLPINFSGILRPSVYADAVPSPTLSPNVAMTWFKGRLYCAYPSGSSTTPDMLMVWARDTNHWYFYQLEATALSFEEDIDQLTIGDTTGKLYALEQFSTAPPEMQEGTYTISVQSADRGGDDPYVFKRFLWIRVDAEEATFTCALYIDGTLRFTFVVVGNRSRTLTRLPPNLFGFVWRLQVSWAQTGSSARGAFHGAECLYEPLEPV